MALIDLILNLAGLLLWLHWRSFSYDPTVRSAPATLAGTLRRAEPKRLRSWQILSGIALLLLVRAWVYWQLGAAAGWNPRMDLGVIALTFRSDFGSLALLYSILSFVRTLMVFYVWAIVLTLINRSTEEPDAIQRLIRLQLGPIARLPWPVLLMVPIAVGALIWIALNPLLVRAGMVSRVRFGQVLEQSLLVGSAVYLTVKYLLPSILFAHLILNYVYLGTSPLWDFIANTSKRLLSPLKWLPLRLARLDFSPLAGALLLLLLLDALPKYLVLRFPDLPRLLWPQ